ncbi:MAG TPA: AmmeMemoRadiSam system radical SAM enzyme [Bacteroidetes bacterium]|nr:AmmeMemoRadiSam system radical SAM enzyme [Bacteroidota bacterium]
MKEAMLYDPAPQGRVICKLCRHYCNIPPGRWGICNVRKNIDGKLYTFVYERAIAVHIDPIEKKPLFHVYPGSSSFSIATAGCNFHCEFCQNADISQIERPKERDRDPYIPGEYLPVDRVVQAAREYGCKTIAYTYTEPTIFFEYAYDIAQKATPHGILNVFVTNGYMTEEALDTIQPYLHAANVDLKGFNRDFYKKKIGARLEGVLETLKSLKRRGIWVEVTTLVVPGYDDDEANLREVARFIRDELGPETPWHISRFFPHYKMRDVPPTPTQILQRAREIGLEAGLRYVYTGNVPGDEGENTYCYSCGALLIRRYGFQILQNRIADSKCPECGAVIDGVGMDGVL